MKIIGHRGAGGLAPENTRAAIDAGRNAGVDAIEIDLQLTADNKFVVCHDASTGRVSQTSMVIRERNFNEVRPVTLSNGERILSLDDALQVIGKTPAVLDMKGDGWAKPLAELLKNGQYTPVTVIAFDHEELAAFHDLMPNTLTYGLQDFHPTDLLHALQVARAQGFTGVDLNFWLLNPLTYWLARRWNIEIIVYTVNTPWIARFLSMLFPHISITTDRPDKFQFLRK